MHNYECIASNVDINLQSGQVWAKLIVSFREWLNDSSSCVFIHHLHTNTACNQFAESRFGFTVDLSAVIDCITWNQFCGPHVHHHSLSRNYRCFCESVCVSHIHTGCTHFPKLLQITLVHKSKLLELFGQYFLESASPPYPLSTGEWFRSMEMTAKVWNQNHFRFNWWRSQTKYRARKYKSSTDWKSTSAQTLCQHNNDNIHTNNNNKF